MKIDKTNKRNRLFPKAILIIFLISITYNCKNDSDLKELYQTCFLLKNARANLKIDKDTTLYFPIQSLSSIGERSTTFSLDTSTIGKENDNFITPLTYKFNNGETTGEISITLKHIDSDSLVRIVLNMKTDSCIGYAENTQNSKNYRSVKIEYQSTQTNKKGNF